MTAVQANLEGYRSNDALNRGDIVALGDLGASLTSKGGNAVNYDNFNYVDGRTTMNNEAGAVLTADEYAYKGESLAVNGSTGLITDATPQLTTPMVGKKIILSTAGIELEGAEGYIYNSFNIETDGNMRMISGWDLTAGTNYSTTTVGGDWALVSMKGTVIDDSKLVDNKVGGNISMEGRTGVDARTSLTSDNGNIWLSSLEGEVKTQNVNAENGMVMIASHDNGISLGKEITGKDVILYADKGNINYNGDPDARVTATEQLVISGKEVVLPVVDGGGSSAVTAENYKAVHTSDAVYTGLQVKDAVVEVENGTLTIDRLSVTGNASFKAEGFDTNVFGAEGTYQPGYHATYYDVGGGTGGTGGSESYKLSAVIGFNDLMDVEQVKDRVAHMEKIIGQVRTSVEESKAKPAQFNGNNDGWMNLYIDDSNHQRSSGVLLDIDDYYFSGNQRLSLRDLFGKEEDFQPQAVFFDLLQPVTSQPRTLQGVTVPSQSYGEIVAVDGGMRNATAEELVVSEE